MTVQTKSAIILLATLLIGMVLGALLFGTVQRQRFQHALRLVRPDRFTASVEEVIRPVDDEQRRAVGRILQAFDLQMRADRQEKDEHMRTGLDSLQLQLSLLLDEEQVARLQEHIVRHRQALRRPPPRMRPPGMGPPPGERPPPPPD
ncbi:MAG: hypothetical protein HN712_03960 [Gemmatimonadetes bacterium]|jgi:hypothetical protein|nr:hypothetical protein [Gemmatimonadota bacterium]MBT7859437.1 hypothetical protein [Gemmatimonadota bacterium]